MDSLCQLLFGARRLRAIRDMLRWDRLPTIRVNVSSIVAGEYAENEIRKNFTASERVAIAATLKAVEQKAAKERQRMSKGRGVTKGVDNGPHLNGQKTRDVVARKVGFGSGKELERAEKVMAKGSPALVQAMDAGEVSISAAADVAELPKAEQKVALDNGKAAVRKAAKCQPDIQAPGTPGKCRFCGDSDWGATRGERWSPRGLRGNLPA